MLSYWEKNSFIQYNYIVIGSGITGLSTACEIKEQQPAASVLVLERGLLPTGASTKNAGFACIGTLSEKVYDLGLMGKEQLLNLVKNRWDGLQILRNRLGDDNIAFENNGGYEIILKSGATHHLNKLTEINALFFPLFNKNIFSENKLLINTYGFNKNLAETVIENPLEGQLDTGLMMKCLINYAKKIGIDIITGADVCQINNNGSGIDVVTNNNIYFKCNKLAVCTNAFTGKFFPDEDIKPGRGQVICTAPLANLKIKGTFNFDEGFFYFRNHHNRIILGGGRNLDFENEQTTELGSNPKILNKLIWYLQHLIIPDTNFTIEHEWSGIMAFGKNKLPLVKLVEPNIAIAGRLNGMGVALGSKVAQDVASILLTQ